MNITTAANKHVKNQKLPDWAETEIPPQGLSAYEATMPIVDSSKPIPRVGYMDIKRVHPNPNQPRRHIPEDEIKRLAESVKAHGILQPLLVRLDATRLEHEPQYQIVFGERRWRAAREAGLSEVPVIMRETLNDADSHELAITENINRADLTVLEECEAVATLQTMRSYTISQLMHQLGKGRGWVANRLAAARAGDDLKELLSKYPDALSHVIEIDRVKDERLRRKLKSEAATGATVERIKELIDESRPEPKPKRETHKPAPEPAPLPLDEPMRGSVSSGDMSPEHSTITITRHAPHLAPALRLDSALENLTQALQAIRGGEELTGDWLGVLGQIRALCGEIESEMKK